MVVTYTQNPTIKPYLQDKLKYVKEITKNSEFRSDEIYKDCCYKLPNNKPATKVKNPKRLTKANPVKPCLNNPFRWTKVYRSPLARKHYDCKHPNIVIDRNVVVPEAKVLQNPDDFESLNPPNNFQQPEVVRQTVGTSVTSIIRSKHDRLYNWYKQAMPRLICPCCCGGEDQIETYQNTVDSYESIDLKTVSNPYLNLTSLDASLMSILQLHGRWKSRKTTKIYTDIAKVVLRNTYKNAISLMFPRKL